MHIPNAVLGGGVGSMISILHLITSTTPPKLMAIRFMLYELMWLIGTEQVAFFELSNKLTQISVFSALPIGQSVGGFLLVQKPLFHTGEIRNFTVVFIVDMVILLLAFLWLVFMLSERNVRELELEISKHSEKGTAAEIKTNTNRDDPDIHPIKLLFDFENVKSMFRTVLKKRAKRVRLQLLLIILSLFIFLIHVMGKFKLKLKLFSLIQYLFHQAAIDIQGQFMQKVYLWSPDWSAYMNSIAHALSSIAILVVVPTLTKVIKISDVNLSLVGFIALLTLNLIKGSWLSPIGELLEKINLDYIFHLAFYMSMAIGSIAGASNIGARSYVTKIVGKDEIGKIMSFMTALNTLSPVLSSTISVLIFKYTIDSYPGTVFQFIAFLCLIPVYVMIWIDLSFGVPLEDRSDTHEANDNEKDHSDISQLDETYKSVLESQL